MFVVENPAVFRAGDYQPMTHGGWLVAISHSMNGALSADFPLL